MSTDPEFIEFVTDQLSLGARLTHRKMFGEYAFYLDAKVVALACDNSLFIKPSSAVAALALVLPQRPPYPGARDYSVADELLDDREAIRGLILETAARLPAPKPRRPKGRRRSPPRRSGPGHE